MSSDNTYAVLLALVLTALAPVRAAEVEKEKPTSCFIGPAPVGSWFKKGARIFTCNPVLQPKIEGTKNDQP